MAAPSSTTNRRAFLTAAAALSAPLAAVPALAAVTVKPHPDAALLDLGRRFDALHLEWTARRPVYEAVNEAWGTALRDYFKARGNEPTPDEVYFDLFARADPHGALAEESAIFARLDPLSEAILAHPAATVEGLAVKARALTFNSDRDIWDAESASDLDHHDETLRSFVENVLRLAGVDRFGRPLGMEAAHV